MWPVDYSHWMNIKIILDELVQKGHEVTILRPSISIFLDPTVLPGLKFETFSTSFRNDDMEIIFASVVDIWTYEFPRDTCLSYSPLLQNIIDEYSD